MEGKQHEKGPALMVYFPANGASFAVYEAQDISVKAKSCSVFIVSLKNHWLGELGITGRYVLSGQTLENKVTARSGNCNRSCLWNARKELVVFLLLFS